MTRVGDMFASLFVRDPIPEGRPSRLITSTTPPGGSFASQRQYKGEQPMTRMTRDSLKSVIESVEMDPLAGMGTFTKKDLLIDRLLAHFNTVESRDAGQPTAPKPILTEPQSQPARVEGNANIRIAPGAKAVVAAAASARPVQPAGGQQNESQG